MKQGTLSYSIILLTVSLISSQALFAQHGDMHDEHPLPEGAEIGNINFGVDCSDAVRENFNHALGMLHHMMYESARSTFEKIAKSEPGCAMAYWGIATTLFQPIWPTRPSVENIQNGLKNIEKAAQLVESEREKHLIDATAAFFSEPASANYNSRIQRWHHGAADAYNAYPQDADIAAFYALSLLSMAQRTDHTKPLFDEAEMVLREIYKRNSAHPGAIHYTIHATDADGRAKNAPDIVEAYGKIAPEVPHALHMPSHIYVRLGDWPRVIEWNQKSAEAALKHPVNGAISHHYIHAIDYLVYAYLQRGEDEKAETIYEDVLAKDKYQSSFISTFHFAAIPARLAVEQRNWDKASNLKPRSPEYLPWNESPWAEGHIWFASGLGAVHTGDTASATKSEQKLNQLHKRAKEQNEVEMAAYLEIDRRVLAGRIAHEHGNVKKAIELTRSAVELEKTVEKHPVTPGALLPPNEALGDLLMELNRPADAHEAYKASDAIWPGRFNTLLGAARAAKEAGEILVAQQYYKRLLANTGDQADRSGIHEARGFIAGNE